MFHFNAFNISGTGVAQLPESAKLLALEMEKTLKEEGGASGHH